MPIHAMPGQLSQIQLKEKATKEANASVNLGDTSLKP
jgi:hypothetical protein